jgi:hypothetical protein
VANVLYGVLGTLAVLFLVRFLFRVRRWRRWRRGGPPASFALRGLFRRLGTRPEQEQVLLADAKALSAEMAGLRADWLALRGQLADLVGESALDERRLEEVLAARLEKLAALRGRAASALARFHAALDDSQRRVLAEMLRAGPRHRWAHGRGC